MIEQHSLHRAPLALLMVLAAATSEGNSIQVTAGAALVGQFGLRITLDDPALTRPTEAWVSIGPDKGMVNETAIHGGFFIDPGNLTMSRTPGPQDQTEHFCFLSFSQDTGPQGAKVILFLEPGPDGTWLIGARIMEDSNPRLVVAGRASLIEYEPVVLTAIEFEWGAASAPGARDGYLRLFQAVDTEKTLLFERTDLDNGAQTLNHLRIGVVDKSHHSPGTYGELLLDDIELYRSPAAIIVP